MQWNVEYTDTFETWWIEQTDALQNDIAAVVALLEERGPELPHPYSSSVNGSRHGHMRELRIQHAGSPYRILYAFDPQRSAILLLGGCKRGRDRWYEINVPLADTLYDEHLDTLKDEGLIP